MLLLVLAICAALMANANLSAATAAGGGRLLIKRSPVMADNVTIAVTIDGKPAGSVRRGQTYDQSIAAGHHVLTASPNRLGGKWSTTLEVRAGETYSFVASYNVDKLVLTPVKSR